MLVTFIRAAPFSCTLCAHLGHIRQSNLKVQRLCSRYILALMTLSLLPVHSDGCLNLGSLDQAAFVTVL